MVRAPICILSSSTALSAGRGNTYSPSTQPSPGLLKVCVTSTRARAPVTVACMRVCWRSAGSGGASGADFSSSVPAPCAGMLAASAGDQTTPSAMSAISASQLAMTSQECALAAGP